MISFSGIHKQYGKQLIFVDASFQLNPGEKVGLVGPNGADAEPDTLGTASQFLVYLHRDPAKDAPLAVALAQRAMAGGGQDSSDQLLLLAEAQRFNHQVKESKESAQAALKILEATPKGLGHGTDFVQARELIRSEEHTSELQS